MDEHDEVRQEIGLQAEFWNEAGGKMWVDNIEQTHALLKPLGDAIQKVYGLLRRESRVIGPSPTYSTHSSGEAAHAGQSPLCYRLDPDNNWYPDLDDLRLFLFESQAVVMLEPVSRDLDRTATLFSLATGIIVDFSRGRTHVAVEASAQIQVGFRKIEIPIRETSAPQLPA